MANDETTIAESGNSFMKSNKLLPNVNVYLLQRVYLVYLRSLLGSTGFDSKINGSVSTS